MGGPYKSYVMCGTPRSGSTMLCEMLWATRAAGRPNSYFREQDIASWADAWHVLHTEGRETAQFDHAYLQAMLREGRADTGVFGVRIMWASMQDTLRRLRRANQHDGDARTQFALAFGNPLFIHVSRQDKVAQAVSRLRAEQSGVWHLNADGSILEGAQAPGALVYDRDRLAGFIRELKEHEAAWNKFFTQNGIEPLRLEYETTTAAPKQALRQILVQLGVDPGKAEMVPVPTAKMADGLSADWIRRFRDETNSA